VDYNSDRKDIAPLALLVHPQQPLSYLERLIQSELPPITAEKGNDKIPRITFRAMEAPDDETRPNKRTQGDDEGEVSRDQSPTYALGEGGVQSYSGAGREGKGEDKGEFVRWSSSTEIGDFIRDAARAKEFEIEIEGHTHPI
jgi:calcium uniporter protein, mitochondrial